MIGIYGGSFDPVHFGHLKTATSLKTELKLDHLFLVAMLRTCPQRWAEILFQ